MMLSKDTAHCPGRSVVGNSHPQRPSVALLLLGTVAVATAGQEKAKILWTDRHQPELHSNGATVASIGSSTSGGTAAVDALEQGPTWSVQQIFFRDVS